MSDIKECLVSRWGNNGYIIEVDYSQLEVIGQAFLSGDVALMKDINDGVDMHCMGASFLYEEDYDVIKNAYLSGDPYWTSCRKKAKGPNFLIQYGGGAKTMAKNTGLPVKQCKIFIDNYYSRYTGVKKWQEEVANEVLMSRRPSKFKTKKGVPARIGSYTSVTGRTYKFIEEDSFGYGKEPTTFPPTKMKNYPVQGFAADIVTLMLGVLFVKLKQSDIKDKLLLINTVHDSIIFDCHEQVLDRACARIKTIMENTPFYLKKEYGLDFGLPLKVDVEYGRNWKDLTTYIK